MSKQCLLNGIGQTDLIEDITLELNDMLMRQIKENELFINTGIDEVKLNKHLAKKLIVGFTKILVQSQYCSDEYKELIQSSNITDILV